MAADDVVKGLLIGGLLGAAVGMLYAPKSGKETREDIRHSAEELLDKAKNRYEEAYRTLEKMAEQEKESYLGKRDRLKKAFEAGVEAFRAEQTATR